MRSQLNSRSITLICTLYHHKFEGQDSRLPRKGNKNAISKKASTNKLQIQKNRAVFLRPSLKQTPGRGGGGRENTSSLTGKKYF